MAINTTLKIDQEEQNERFVDIPFNYIYIYIYAPSHDAIKVVRRVVLDTRIELFTRALCWKTHTLRQKFGFRHG